jgi:lon-related putative ATP-dependent protease
MLEPLRPDVLRRRCDPASLGFTTTAELPDTGLPHVQPRALEALAFGLGMRGPGYNVYVAGPAEAGKMTLLLAEVARRATEEPAPSDICYVHNFGDPRRPLALRLPAGRGAALRRDLLRLVEDLRTAIPAALESEELSTRKQVIEDELKERHERAFAELREEAARRGVAIMSTPLGFAFGPAKDGEVLSSDEFHALPDEERARIAKAVEEMQARLRGVVEDLQEKAREARDRVRKLFRDLAGAAVAHLIDDLKARYAEWPAVAAHIEAVRADVVENVGDFLSQPDRERQSPLAAELPGVPGTPAATPFRRHLVNLLVDHSATKGAPVVHESHPTLQNLVGRVEHVAHLGSLVTDFHLIQAGSLHRASGGTLVLDARGLLSQPFAWEALKRALAAKEVRIETVGDALGFASTTSLQPEPVPLDVKVVLVGDRYVAWLLDRLDPEFHALFKVVADFDDDLDRTPDGERGYARLVAAIVRQDGLLPFESGGVAAIVERGARLAADSEKLSTHIGSLAELIRESEHCARAAGRAAVAGDDVRAAVAAQERRSGRIRDRMIEETRRGTILIDTSGRKAGQVNGLSVTDLGRSAFGRPCRITARVRLGRGEVVDIEREVELSGPIHSKGVLILAGFLAARYALDHPLALSATLVFEQSYGMVEGDSASCAELCALLSALADAPIDQAIAVTGSVNQHGQVQPVGGVNEKIEGFFDTCAALGFRGGEGVVLPASNVKHLMLREEVVDAVRAGRFRVFAATEVDEALEVLTGVPAGARGPDGKFPEGSVNARVEARLVALAERRLALGRSASENGK